MRYRSGALSDARGTAHGVDELGNLCRLPDFDGPDRQAEFAQLSDGLLRISRVPDQDQVGLECDYSLDIEPESVPDSRQAGRGRGVLAVLDRSEQPLAGARCENTFGEMRRQRHDALGRRAQHQQAAVGLDQADVRRRERQRDAEQENRKTVDPAQTQTMTPTSNSRAKTVSQTPSILQVRSMANWRLTIGPSSWSA